MSERQRAAEESKGEWIIVPEGEREVTSSGWGAVMLDEVLFRGAQLVSELQQPPERESITVEIPVSIGIDRVGEAVVLRFASAVEGTIVLRLEPPF